jgi:hypothetical protein
MLTHDWSCFNNWGLQGPCTKELFSDIRIFNSFGSLSISHVEDEDGAKQTLYTCPSLRLCSHLLTLFLIPVYCTSSNPSNSLTPTFNINTPKMLQPTIPLPCH